MGFGVAVINTTLLPYKRDKTKGFIPARTSCSLTILAVGPQKENKFDCPPTKFIDFCWWDIQLAKSLNLRSTSSSSSCRESAARSGFMRAGGLTEAHNSSWLPLQQRQRRNPPGNQFGCHPLVVSPLLDQQQTMQQQQLSKAWAAVAASDDREPIMAPLTRTLIFEHRLSRNINDDGCFKVQKCANLY